MARFCFNRARAFISRAFATNFGTEIYLAILRIKSNLDTKLAFKYSRTIIHKIEFPCWGLTNNSRH